jgi:coproporphyrinogen III oxidase-like Fe-S oxidoreductase
MGFGADAHSFLSAAVDPYVLLRAESVAQAGPLRVINDDPAGGSRPCAVAAADVEAVRFATPDSLDQYLAGKPLTRTVVSRQQAREEAMFLGLRLNRGVNLRELAASYSLPPETQQTVAELCQIGLLDYDRQREVIRLTPKGRLLSNEVFEKFIA